MDLTPGTFVYYSFGEPEASNGGMSDTNRFFVPPAPGTLPPDGLHFFAFGGKQLPVQGSACSMRESQAAAVAAAAVAAAVAAAAVAAAVAAAAVASAS